MRNRRRSKTYMTATTLHENPGPVSFMSMFTSPFATFDSLRKQPRWLVPAAFSAMVSAAANFYVIQRIGLVRLIETASRSNSVIDPQAAIQNVLAHQNQILFFQAVSIFLNVFLVALAAANFFWLALMLFGFDISFRKSLAVVAHANMLPIVARGCMTVLTAAAVRDAGSLDIKNPLATNLAFFLRPSSPAALRILTSLDVIALINAGLLIVGLARVCPKLSLTAASATVFICWAIYIGITLLVPFSPL